MTNYLAAAVVLLLASTAGITAAHWTEQSNVVWTTPSRDASGSMPLGNGQVGLNLWVEENGDLRFYINRTDSYSEISRLLKVGAVRVTLTPNPLVTGAKFRQELVLRDGVCVVTAGEGAKKVTLRVWVDSASPTVYCTGESASPVSVKATAETWRTERRAVPSGEEQNSAWTLRGAPFEIYESADVFPTGTGSSVAWYHRNEESPAFRSTIEVQGLQSIAEKAKDPIIHRTFGGWMSAPGFQAAQGHSLTSGAPVKSFAIAVAAPCAQTATAQEWLNQAKKLASAADAPKSLKRTAAWWQEFWNRSWIVAGNTSTGAVPHSGDTIRIGLDSNGQNAFPGSIGQVNVISHALLPDEVAAAANSAPATGPAPRDLPVVDLKQGMTLLAWVKPEAATDGRIFDCITAGGSDGFLFDIHPGDTLRFIVGNTTVTAPRGTLKMSTWQHAAATIDGTTGAIKLYLDGKVVAQAGEGLVGGASPITRGYTLQRYVQACGGRGPFPIKFNGTMFTVEPAALGNPYNPDWRNWGDCHWWQNIRFPYHAMIMAGDYEMMQPMFDMYESVRPLAEARSKLYHNAQGSYIPETMTVWGTYSNGDYGWGRDGHQPNEVLCPYWQYAWNQGPELVALMLDRYDYTDDREFLKKQVLPMAESVLKYFDTRFKKDSSGKIILDPTQAVETLWYGVINDAPTTSGLHAITARLVALPADVTTSAQRAFFRRMQSACPDIPVEDVKIGDTTVRRLAVAQKYNPARSNCENPELYAIWPFRLYGIGKPGLAEAKAAYDTRGNHLPSGWGYDGNCAAVLGMADEAAQILNIKAANSNPAYRWPASWGPNFDWVPDQDHGSNLLLTTQLMLVQSDGDKIRLLPAWPKTWDVSFKLHAPHNTTVECIYQKGHVESLKVTPESRRKDVIMPK